MNDYLIQLGLDIKMIVAGFVGGVIHTFIFRQTDLYTAIGSILAGIGTANYIGRTAATMLNVNEGFGGFVVGLSAMAICQGIVAAIKKIQFIRFPPTDSNKP